MFLLAATARAGLRNRFVHQSHDGLSIPKRVRDASSHRRKDPVQTPVPVVELVVHDLERHATGIGLLSECVKEALIKDILGAIYLPEAHRLRD